MRGRKKSIVVVAYVYLSWVMPSINDQYPYVPKLNPCQFGTSGYDLEVCDLLTGLSFKTEK